MSDSGSSRAVDPRSGRPTDRQTHRASVFFWSCFVGFFGFAAAIGLVAHLGSTADWAPALLLAGADVLLAYLAVWAPMRRKPAMTHPHANRFVGRGPGRTVAVLVSCGSLSLVGLSIHQYAIGNAYSAAPACMTAAPEPNCKETTTATVTTSTYNKESCAASVADRFGPDCSAPSTTITMATAFGTGYGATIYHSQPNDYPTASKVTLVLYDNRVYALNGIPLITDYFTASGFATSLEVCFALLVLAAGLSIRPRPRALPPDATRP